jgi:MFS family permease
LLFPAVATLFGAAADVGRLHVAVAVGAVIGGLTANYIIKGNRHGLIVLLAACSWAVAIVFFGLSKNWTIALACLGAAGYADMVSGAYRQTIWNRTIPKEIRGRMAGLEMISFLAGPMIGNAQLGVLADLIGVRQAICASGFVGLLNAWRCRNYITAFCKVCRFACSSPFYSGLTRTYLKIVSRSRSAINVG